MFDRGHIDHFGLAVTDSDAFWSLRDRLVERGHSNGDVTDFGPVLGFDFIDPDGMTCEVNLVLDPELAGGHAPSRTGRSARPDGRRGGRHLGGRRDRQTEIDTGKVASHITVPRNTAQPAVSSTTCMRRESSFVLTPAKNSVTANSTTAST